MMTAWSEGWVVSGEFWRDKASRDKISDEDKDTVLSRIKGTTRPEDMKDCDLVIEAIMENMEEKKRLFAALDNTCNPDTILTTNTSSLSVTELAKATRRPAKVMGAPFTTPFPLGKLPELVKTDLCSQETSESVKAWAQMIEREVVVAPDIDGLIVNRLYQGYAWEALRLSTLDMLPRKILRMWR